MNNRPVYNYTERSVERPAYTPGTGSRPMPAGYCPEGEYVVSWDRLAGPHSRWLSLSVPFESAAAAAYLASKDAEDQRDALVIRLDDLYSDCNAGTCAVCQDR